MSEEIEKEVETEGQSSEHNPHNILDLDGDTVRIHTHTELNPDYVGEVETLLVEKCKLSLVTTKIMRADPHDLVHSGFIGSSAEYAALLAINEPNGMVFSVNAEYFACARVGDEIIFTATAKHSESRKREVDVVAKIESIKIYEAKIFIIIPEYHPLKIQLLEIAGAND